MKELEKDPTQGANIDYFNKRIQKLVASGNRALIEETAQPLKSWPLDMRMSQVRSKQRGVMLSPV